LFFLHETMLKAIANTKRVCFIVLIVFIFFFLF
jgi:hypothetical protein